MKAFTDIQRQAEIDIELWIGEEDFRVRRMVIDARLVSAGSSNEVTGLMTYRTVADYSEFDKPVDIAPPLTPTGQLETGWLSSGDAQAPDTRHLQRSGPGTEQLWRIALAQVLYP